MIERPLVRVLRKRIREPRRFLQIVLGPRQVGKTTIVRQALSTLKQPSFMIAADDLGVIGSTWLIEHWEQARLKATEAVESAVGSHLLAITASTPAEVFYWREGDDEVDYVLATPAKRVLIEVKSGDIRDAYSGASALRSHHGDAPLIVVGSPEHPIESVLSYTLTDLL